MVDAVVGLAKNNDSDDDHTRKSLTQNIHFQSGTNKTSF